MTAFRPWHSVAAITRATPAAVATLAFAALVSLGLSRHEMWRDELQAWMIVRDSGSLAELAHNVRYEGHPPLWHVCLYGVSRLGRDPRAMQALHGILATATAGLLIASPLPPVLRLGMAFGYFGCYEYAVVSRGYVLGTCLTFLFCRVYPLRRRSWLIPGTVLALLANTSVQGLMLAAALGLALVVEHPPWRTGPGMPSRANRLAGAAIAIAGALAAIVQALPPPDGRFLPEPTLSFDALRLFDVAATLCRGYLPAPRLIREFWNTNLLLDGPGFGPARFVVGIAVALVIAVDAFRRLAVHAPARWCLAVGTLTMLGFSYVRLAGAPRHQGHLFVLLVACFWLAASERTPDSLRAGPVLAWVAAVQVGGAVLAHAADLRFPFSAASAAATLVARMEPPPVLVGSSDSATSSISGYLDRPIFHPESGRFGTFILWNTGRSVRSPAEALRAAVDAHKSSGSPALLVLNYELMAADGKPVEHAPFDPSTRVDRLAALIGTIVGDESYYLYLVSKAPSS